MKRLKISMPERGNWSRQLWREYMDARERVIDAVFDAADRQGLNNYELALKARLSPSTVHNLEHYITVEPRDSTIFKLAHAVGLVMEVRAVKKVKLKLAKVG